jgi:hypothetical protein
MEIKKVDTNINIVNEYIKQNISSKHKYSNYFNQNISCDDSYCKTDYSLIIIKPNENYQRIYIISNDFNDAVELLGLLKGTNIINIPSKGDISDWRQLMLASGFSSFAVYERYSNTKIKKMCSTDNIIYAKPDQEEEIYNLFHDSGFFSPYTDYLPSHSELSTLIKNNQVIINENDMKITGAFIFQIEGVKYYLRAWIDKNNNGIKLLLETYSIIFEKKINYVYFWVNSENKSVQSMHKLMGAKPDGLKDYTFIKQTQSKINNKE